MDNNNDNNNTSDILNMTDEEILNMPEPSYESSEEDLSSDADDEYEAEENEVEEESVEDDSQEDEDDYEEQEDDSDEEGVEEDTLTDDYEGEDNEEADKEDTKETEDTDDSDYKSKYEALMAPFRADKRDIKVDTPEELRRLAQKGVGYDKKMAAIKPLRKIGKMLEDAGLLDEAKLSFLIDLNNKDAKAISKLVADSGIDPLDIDTEGTETYEPKAYTVDDNQLELSDTLSTLSETTSGVTVINEVDTKWDQNSKQVLLENPHLLIGLEKHVEDGRYEKIMSFMEKEKALGNIPKGVSDLQAYEHIGKHLESEAVAKPEKKAPVVTKKKKSDTKRNKLREAAALTRRKATKTNKIKQDFHNLTDEEFLKL